MRLSDMVLWQKTEDFMKLVDLQHVAEAINTDTPILVMPLNVVSPAIIELAEKIGFQVLSPNPEAVWNPSSAFCEVDEKPRVVGHVRVFSLATPDLKHHIFKKVTEGTDATYENSDPRPKEVSDITISLEINIASNYEITQIYELLTDVLMVKENDYGVADYKVYAATTRDNLPSVDSVANVYIDLQNFLYLNEREYPCSMDSHALIDVIYGYREVEEALDQSVEAGRFGPESVRVVASQFGLTASDLQRHIQAQTDA